MGIHLLIITSLFFLIRWLRKNNAARPGARNFWALSGRVIAYLLFLIGLVLGVSTYINWIPQRSFERAKWLTNTQTRYKMKEDLLGSKVLEGKSKQEVIEILGPPMKSSSVDTWSYNMGSSTRFIGFCDYILYLHFEDDHLIEAKAVELLD